MPMLSSGERRALRGSDGRFCVRLRTPGRGMSGRRIASTITAPVMKGTRGGDSEGPVSVEVNVQQTAFFLLMFTFLSGTAN